MKYDSSIMDIMENSIHQINENYNKPLRLNIIAKQNFLSPATYSRYFLEFTHQKFSDYVNYIRVEHAKKDLIFSDLPLTEIALEHGFSNSSVFSKLFKQYTNLSPSDYRKQKRTSSLHTYKENQTITLNIDHSFAPSETFKKNWLFAINTGEANFLLNPDFQQQILLLKNKLDFKYVRFWDIFSLNIFSGDINDSLHMNFNYIDDVLDFLTKNEILPWIDLTKTSDPQILDISNALPAPQSSKQNIPYKYFMVIYEKLFRHWISRYGSEKVSQWRFEYWFHYSNDHDTISQFAQNFYAVKQLLKKLIPEAQLGTFGSSLHSRYDILDKLLDVLSSQSLPDFFSIYCFPYQNTPNNIPQKMEQSRFTQTCITLIKTLLQKHHINEAIPFYISEWNMTISPRNAINDSSVSATILLDNIEETLDHPYPIVYYHASDLAVARQDKLPMVFGGTGILTKNALFKPTFFALSFYKKLSPYIVTHGPGYIVTTDLADRYDFLLFNSLSLPKTYYTKKEYEITNDFVALECFAGNTLSFSIHLKTSCAHYHQRTNLLSSNETDLLGHLKKLGHIEQPSVDDIEYLQHTACPQLSITYHNIKNNRLHISQTLNPHDICFISLTPSE